MVSGVKEVRLGVWSVLVRVCPRGQQCTSVIRRNPSHSLRDVSPWAIQSPCITIETYRIVVAVPMNIKRAFRFPPGFIGFSWLRFAGCRVSDSGLLPWSLVGGSLFRQSMEIDEEDIWAVRIVERRLRMSKSAV